MVDKFASIAIWSSPAAVPTQFYAADLRPTRFNKVYASLAPIPSHPLSVSTLAPATRTSQNFYVFGDQGFAIVVMADSNNRGAVAWLSLSNCAQYSNCSACLGAGDPWCSWCLAPSGSAALPDGQCAEKRTCLLYENEDSTCPLVSSVTPATGSLFGQTPILSVGSALSGTNLRFRFTSLEDNLVVVDSSARTFDPSTRLRATGATPAVPRSGNYTVELIRQATLVASSATFRYVDRQNFTFYNCSDYTSCSECSSGARPECGWCLFDAKCIATRDTCAIPDSPRVSLGSTQSCPSLISMSPNSSLVPVPAGQTIRISATRLFSSPVSPAFQCVFEFTTPQVVTATYDSVAVRTAGYAERGLKSY
jgi:hypothetical protein